ncbi:MAG: hypothetical protein CME62_16160 [Halobacteriovoraceae bacterium]|nr:hypothetical protein [Halobacteriovoraceae bacterium]|tara:strand:- start:3038 stop:3586 length:549 start_codon:yes stop_codon:yes gene_type:complete
MKTIFLLLLIVSATSCGLKITTEVNENLLNGQWQLENIFCFTPDNSTNFKERYDFSDSSDVQVVMDLGNGDMQYDMTSSDCTTTAHGNFVTDYEDDFSDELDFFNVVSGSTCDIDVNFVGDDGNGVGTVKFALLASESKQLTWEVNEDKDYLSLDFYTGFQGSNLGSYCGNACNCEARFSKN